MKNIICIEKENMPQWDAFVKGHPYGWICHLSGWKEVIEKSFKHIKGHFLAIRDENSRTITGGIPVYVVKSWLTGNRLVSIPFAQLCDPLISTQQDMDMLLGPLVDIYQQNRCNYIEIRSTFSDICTGITVLKRSASYKHHYLLLNRDPEELKKSFHAKSIRPRISKAIKNQLALAVASSEYDLCQFYKLLFYSRKRLGLPPIPYHFFKALWETFGNTRKLSVLLAMYKTRPIAGTLIFKFNNKMSSEFIADDTAYRHLYPVHFLDWESIKLASAEGCGLFSFGRTNIDNKSLTTFKNSWGTVSTDLNTYYYPCEAAEKAGARDLSWGYKLIKKSSLYAPESIFRAIGNFCYRHLG